MAAELILFTLGGAIIYSQVGEEYITSPAYGSLKGSFSKIVAGWVLPTIISAYSSWLQCPSSLVGQILT